MAIKISKETEQRLVVSIKRFFAEQLDEDVGELKGQLFLDFCLKEVGPCIYNQAIADAQAHLQERIAELDANCHEPEFLYWKR